MGDRRVEIQQRLPQRGIQGGHGAIALGGGENVFPLHRDFDRSQGLAAVVGTIALVLTVDVKALEVEEAGAIAQGFAHQQLKAGLSCLKLVALMLQGFEAV